MTPFKPTPIEQNGIRVLTTAQLAEAYETDIKIIAQNFNRNKSHYIEGKHFFRLTGDELKEFKNSHNFDNNFKQTSHLYLWTERGSLLHAKSINTDKAWDVYEFLIDNYFRTREIHVSYSKLYNSLKDDITSAIYENLQSDIEKIVNKILDERKENREKELNKSEYQKLKLIITVLSKSFADISQTFEYIYKKILEMM